MLEIKLEFGLQTQMDSKITKKIYKYFINFYGGNERISEPEILALVNKRTLEDLQKRDVISEIIESIKLLINAKIEIFPERQRDKDLEITRNNRIVDHVLVIDSKDRDTRVYTAANCFTMDLQRPIMDVNYVELLGCCILDDKEAIGDVQPYLLLVLDELGSTIECTNVEVSKAFAILREYVVLDGFRHYKIDPHMTKEYPMKLNITRLTVKVKKANGDICEFKKTDSPTITTTIQIMVRLICGK
jgi:hypothetical protein